MNSSELFRVSAVIPAYNAGAFISRAIESVLAQTRRADEIIVVDDGSTDNTAEQVQKYGDQVRYIYQENAGASAARNTGIKAAQYEWIAFLDGDDEWLPDYLKLQIELLRRNPNLKWTMANYDRCLCDEQRRSPHFDPDKARNLLEGKDYFDDYFDAFTAEVCGCTDTMVVRRDVIEEAGLFRDGLPNAQDTDMWFRLAMRCPQVGYIPQPIAVYHLHKTGIGSNCGPTRKKLEIICDLVEQNLKLAENCNRQDKFRPCAVSYLRRLIRSCLFDHTLAPDVKKIPTRFQDLFHPGYKSMIAILTCFPRVTATLLHLISRIVRVLNLRRRVVPRPARSGK